jgi:hypothetical protein
VKDVSSTTTSCDTNDTKYYTVTAPTGPQPVSITSLTANQGY